MLDATVSDAGTVSRTVPDSLTLELYRKMLTVFYVEERIKIFVRQGKCPLHTSTRGHEKWQVAMALLLKPCHEWFFSYYRSKAIAIGFGMPLKDIFLGMLSREGPRTRTAAICRSSFHRATSTWLRKLPVPAPGSFRPWVWPAP